MKVIECPRDAMQGLEGFIPTDHKVRYINQLLKVGFDTIDFGSFVSAKAIPQLRDTREVLDQLDLSTTTSKLLAIVANTRGAEEAAGSGKITYIGFPLSMSETFQKRNTNKSIAQALLTVEEIQNICLRSGKTMVTYVSMGFGNPYGDEYDVETVDRFVGKLNKMGMKIVSLADTIGVARPEQIDYLFTALIRQYPSIEFGAHLHSQPALVLEKLEAAYGAGCQRFDGAIRGFGGCPMAEDELVGNLATEIILAFLEQKGVGVNYNQDAMAKSLAMADITFPNH